MTDSDILQEREYTEWMKVLREALDGADVDMVGQDAGLKDGQKAAQYGRTMLLPVEAGYIRVRFQSSDSCSQMRILAQRLFERMTQQSTYRSGRRAVHQEGGLLNNILHAQSRELRTYAALQAAECGKRLDIERVLIVLRARDMRIDAEADEILSMIESMPGGSGQDLAGLVGDDQLVICRCISRRDVPVRLQTGEYIDTLLERLHERFKAVFQIGVGFAVTDIEEYARSLRLVMHIMERQSSEEYVKYAYESLPDCIISSLSPELLDHFLAEGEAVLREHQGLADAAQALVICDMNQAAAAQRLYVHRNTLALYMKRLKALLHIDPVRNDRDKLYLMLLCSYHLKCQNM